MLRRARSLKSSSIHVLTLSRMAGTSARSAKFRPLLFRGSRARKPNQPRCWLIDTRPAPATKPKLRVDRLKIAMIYMLSSVIPTIHGALCVTLRATESTRLGPGYEMKNRSMLVTLAVSVLLVPALLVAHHGQAAYDVTQSVTIKGTVTNFKFNNPHCIVTLDVKDENGQKQEWQGELTSPNHLVRAGWTVQTFKPGDNVTLTGYRAKTGATSMWITKVILGNGEEMKIGAGN